MNKKFFTIFGTKFRTSGNSNKSFAKWSVRQRISVSKKRDRSDETKHSRSEGLAKSSVKVTVVRQGDNSFIRI